MIRAQVAAVGQRWQMPLKQQVVASIVVEEPRLYALGLEKLSNRVAGQYTGKE
ncbi:hypothetical protein PPTG_23491 [Phytophthora nicotianae INRA-310]|uniref:Uncharacterized protein n=2 Tax=Phytophthora nicotianae TaxID=4792 RepID=W2PWD4_PHYN3|nr:hypothetical protein PPTG_23491 [Phytophthora nicotianae INRA-310]ETI40891.1 hypothetical protein F443_13821 [Phytophthora nicotianae P1569]ETN05263.1 hypothetical protein PPTG_23491 [Phytophthora nicotianae INRA-310]